MKIHGEGSRGDGPAQAVDIAARGPMTCRRCRGLMAQEPCVELDYDHDGDQSWRQDGWRCVTCGNYLDTVIDQNRPLGHRSNHP
jgi:hypothetical protein